MGVGQFEQAVVVNVVLREERRIALQPQPAQPTLDLHLRLPIGGRGKCIPATRSAGLEWRRLASLLQRNGAGEVRARSPAVAQAADIECTLTGPAILLAILRHGSRVAVPERAARG